ncbi:MAG: LamG domain-containing protein, partial [Bacteriovoracaceae bacterium]
NYAYPTTWGPVLNGPDPLTVSAGAHGNSLDCSAHTESLYTTLGFDISSNMDFTISFWLNPANNNTQERYLQLYESGTTAFGIGQNVNGKLEVVGAAVSTFGHVPPAGSWTHVALVAYSGGGTLELYVNGSFYESINDSALSTTFESFFVCMDQNDSLRFFGKLDSLGVWNRALKDNEIWDLYNGDNSLD